jgi:RNA polymerase-binding transcription factor DksA
MAKSSKKASPKAAKKSTTKAKTKKPVKAAKKAVPAKSKKTAPKKALKKKAAKPVKKVVAKKVVKKIAPKKAVKAVKAVSKPAAKVLSAPVPKPIAKTYGATNPLKAAPSALNIFPNTTPQRPIAHKPTSASGVSSTEGRTRYADEELKEFDALINQKLEKARSEYKILKDTLNRNNDEGTDATSGGNTKVLEDGAETAEKENMSQLAARQQKYITNLENALVRIKNGTYGICSVTGKLISKERLMAVPHTTQSIEAKMLKQD